MTILAAPTPSDMTATAVESRRAGAYPVFRSLVAWTALVLAVVWAVRDALYLARIEVSFEAAARWLTSLGDDWLGRVVARIASSSFEQAQLLLSIICIGYGLAQIAAAISDRRALGRMAQKRVRARFIDRMAALLFARPVLFVTGVPSDSDLALHFVQGRELVFSPLRLGLWLFPVLGFLGTIIGISAAIEKLPEAMKERGAALSGVVNELHFAFDTTFLGLIAAIILMFITAAAASLWERNEALYRSRAADGSH